MKTPPSLSRIACYLLAIWATTTCEVGLAQSPATEGKPLAWRYQPPTEDATADIRSPKVIETEDQFFDNWYGSTSALEGTQIGSRYSSAVAEKDDGEFPVASANVVVVGHFSTWASYLSKSHRSIYTIVNFVVDRIALDKIGQLTPGSTIPLGIPGGTIRLPGTDRVITDHIRPFSFPCEPNTEYLLFLSYNPSYLPFYEYAKAWKVDGGKLIPVSRFDIQRAARGELSHQGTSLDSAIQEILSRTSH